MNRRHYLALIGTTLGSLGGCAQSPGDDSVTPATDETTPSPTPTDGSTPTPTVDRQRVGVGETVSVNGTSVTVSNPRVRLAIPVSGMHVLPLTTDVGQFVVVDVTVDGSPAAELDEAFGATVGGDRVQESTPQSTTTAGAFGVPFPVGDHDTAAVRWTAGSTTAVDWALPDSVRAALAETPAFRVTSFESRVADGQRVVELAVRNDGGRDGRFLGRLSFEGFSGGDLLSFAVPKGGSERYSGRPGKVLLYFENNGGETLTLQYPGVDGMESVEHTVPVDTETGSPASTATETPTVVDQ
ncbi:hypothetical protein [Haloarcula montana]|uniref:hypothetical protein n=1 Tax=Haloarcula montana TaxID=3111776 RepID=UPI002D769146|nr:hypothetical protein [Haloarcula sp. GH36]